MEQAIKQLEQLIKQTEEPFKTKKANPSNYDLGYIAGLKNALKILKSAQ